MSYNAVLEFLLHLDKIHAIDCYGGGLYKLRFTLYYENNMKNRETGYIVKKTFYGRPYLLPENKFYKNKQNFASSVDDMQENCFCTQQFYLNTNSSDFVEFNKMILFRIDLPCYPKIWTQPLFLDAEIMLFGLLYRLLTYRVM